MKEQLVEETKLAALAKKFRIASGKTKAQAARDMNINRAAIFQAEEFPEASLTKLRSKMIEAYSGMKVSGPFFRIGKE